MRIGTALPQRRIDRGFLDVARECEDLGFHAVSAYDHVVPIGAPPGTPALEAFAALAAVAAVTTRLGLVTLVARAAARPPVMTAHLVRSVRAVAGDRFVLGLGSGDAASAVEDSLLGQPHLSGPDRRARVVETVAAVREMVADATIWLGGNGGKMRDLALEVGADAWNVWALRPEEVADATIAPATISEAGSTVGATGRGGVVAGATIPVTWAGQAVVGETRTAVEERLAAWQPGRDPAERARALHGTPDDVVAQLRALGEVGVTEAYVAFVGGDASEQRRLFAREVLPVV